MFNLIFIKHLELPLYVKNVSWSRIALDEGEQGLVSITDHWQFKTDIKLFVYLQSSPNNVLSGSSCLVIIISISLVSLYFYLFSIYP